MSDNPFRRRPFMELGIDSWKAVVLAVGFLLLAFWMLMR